jgi:hypothetical protein
MRRGGVRIQISGGSAESCALTNSSRFQGRKTETLTSFYQTKTKVALFLTNRALAAATELIFKEGNQRLNL